MKALTLIALFVTMITFQCCDLGSDEDNSLLEANFSVVERNVGTDEQVLFQDESTGNPSTWLWEFPGGSPETSTEQNPTVTYAEEGFKSVTLTVSNGSETDMVEKIDYIEVDSDPTVEDDFVAEFEVDKNVVEVGEEVQFTDITEGATSWEWEFPGGNPEVSTEQNPIVTYSTAGFKTVVLVVTNGEGKTSVSENENFIEVITPQLTESELIEKYDQALIDLKQFIQYTYLFDAVLTNQYELSGDWSDIYNHTYSPNSVKVEKLWNDGFQILDDIALMYLNLSNISDQELMNLYDSRLIIVDSYVRHSLLNYFGYIPFYGPLKTDELSWRVATLATIEDTDLLIYDISGQANSLPEFDNGYYVEYGSEVTFTDAFLKAFRMRFSLTSISGLTLRDPFDIEADFEDIALNHVYIQSPYEEIFDNGWRRESILGFAADGDAEFSSFFNIGDYVPVIRATEPTLIYLETYLRQRNPDEIIGDEADEINDFEAIYNELATYHGYEGLPTTTNEEILDILFEVWIEDFRYEGRAFQVMKRFDKARDMLGIEDYQQLLPIPQSAIDANVNIVQNEGY
ncbi:PKD domain-containing protein [Ekhidna lutea]|uniref:PKD domain-containing protein n=1 Tax=Ekhidna lutea TaxID=447679 RepID=A0A239LPE6_EKHLU|nr:PKD domain-containing protein [Ekhidna lutea]SNT31514.1 PKD domain-containing protein [Ekhidna lutea]